MRKEIFDNYLTFNEVKLVLEDAIENRALYLRKNVVNAFERLMFKSFKLLRQKSMVDKPALRIDSLPLDREEEKMILADKRFDATSSSSFAGQVLTPNFYQRFDDDCKNCDRMALNLKFRFFSAQNGFKVISAKNLSKKFYSYYFKCKRRTPI